MQRYDLFEHIMGATDAAAWKGTRAPLSVIVPAIRKRAAEVGGLRYVFKTVAFYNRVMRREVRDFFETGDGLAFLDNMQMLIEDQYQRAFNQGLRDIGYTNALTNEMNNAIAARVEAELNNLLGFAIEIEAARNQALLDGVPLEDARNPYLSRVDMWANRYNELVSLGVEMGAVHDDLLTWRVGPTEHCATCQALDGVTASKAEWQASGYRPQNAPNPRLACGGYRCQCTLSPADPDTEPTPGGIPRV